MIHGLDLFSGIGGISLALSPWVRPVAYCENDKYAQGVLLSRMREGSLPHAPIWDDVRSLRAEELPAIDIIYGGFPCQDISFAGRGVGLEGKRSGLFFEIVRLAKEIKPTFLFLENVPAIRTRGLPRVIEELSACGYDSRWNMLSAAQMGAPHKRERWFLLAYSNSKRRSCELESRKDVELDVCEPTQLCDGKGDTRSEMEKVAYSYGKRWQAIRNKIGPEEENSTASGKSWWSSEPDVGRVAYGVPARVDRLRGLGNAVVPVQAREAFKRLSGLN